MLLPALLFCLLAPLSVVLAQEQPKPPAAKPNDSISPFTRLGYGYVKNTLLRSAEKMPEEFYSFRPTWIVRSFGQMIGHVADAEYFFCSKALGEKNPALNIQKTKTSKAELIAALKDAFAYCDRAFDSMTEVTANQTVKFQGVDFRKADVLTASIMHTVEHYGNLIVYMRMKNIVPPSTEPDFNPQTKK